MGYIVHGILQAGILEWVAFPFFRGSSHPRDRTQVSHIAGGYLYQLSHKGNPIVNYTENNNNNNNSSSDNKYNNITMKCQS